MRDLVDSDSRWSFQIFLRTSLTLQAQSDVWCQVCSSRLTTEHCQETWSCRRIPRGEHLQIHQRVADQYQGFGPLSLAKRYAYQRQRRHSGRMTDFLLPTGMMSQIRWYRQHCEHITHVDLWTRNTHTSCELKVYFEGLVITNVSTVLCAVCTHIAYTPHICLSAYHMIDVYFVLMLIYSWVI